MQPKSKINTTGLKSNCHFIGKQYKEPGASVIWVWQLKAGEQTVLLPSEPDRGDLQKYHYKRNTITDPWGDGGLCCYEMVLG